MRSNMRKRSIITDDHLWPPASYAGRWPLCFAGVVYLLIFSPPDLRGPLAGRHQTLPTCSLVTHIYEIRSEIWRTPSVRNLAAPKHEISARFRTTLWLDRDYLPNATRHRQSENGKANCGHSRTGKLNLVYFDPQTAKIGPEFWPTYRR